MTEFFYEQLQQTARTMDRRDNNLCLMSKNDSEVLTDCYVIQQSLCTPFVSKSQVHFYYRFFCTATKTIPFSYLFMSHKPQPLLIKDKKIKVFYFDPATSRLSIYKGKKFESVEIEIIKEQNIIPINKKLYKKIIKYKNEYRKERLSGPNETPIVYMLAKDKKNVLIEMEEVDIYPGTGCEEMPRLLDGGIYRAYNKLIKQNLIPCGYISFTKFFSEHRSFHHVFENDEIFINIGVHSSFIKLYRVNSNKLSSIEFKITES